MRSFYVFYFKNIVESISVEESAAQTSKTGVHIYIYLGNYDS